MSGPNSGKRVPQAQAQGWVTATPLPGMKPVAAFVFANAGLVPPTMPILGSMTYSAASPNLLHRRSLACLLFSAASPNIPPGLQRVALVPEV